MIAGAVRVTNYGTGVQSSPSTPRKAALERELWKARNEARAAMARIPASIDTPQSLEQLAAHAREVERCAGRVAAFATLLAAEK